MNFRLVSYWFLLVLFAGLDADAQSVLLGTDFSNVATNDAVYQGQYVAQQFTLTSPIQVSSINVLSCCNYSGTAPMTFWLTNMIGPGTTPLNLLGEAVVNNAAFQESDSLAISGLLSPGTYFIVASSASPTFTQGWWTANAVLPSSVGTVWDMPFLSQGTTNTNPAFAPASTWTDINTGTNPMEFQLVGTVATPEPTSVCLLGAALLLAARRKIVT